MRESLVKSPPKRDQKYDFINPLIGHRLKLLRQEKDISRSRAAKVIGKTLQQLEAIESGQESLTSEYIYKFCMFFEIDAGYFFVDLADIGDIGDMADALKINAHQAKEVRKLIDAYLNLPNREMQKSLVQLAESVAQAKM